MAQSASSSDGVMDWLRALDARHQPYIAVLQRELDERCKRYRDERNAFLESLGGTDGAVTEPVLAASATAARTAEALAFIALAARRAVEGAIVDEELSRTLRGPTPDGPSLARAYDAVQAAMSESSGAESAAALKRALIFMRDLLVLKVCLGSDRPWNNVGLGLALSLAFGRPLADTMEEGKLLSQFIQSFNKIVRCGRDRAEFDSTVRKRYEEWLKDQDTAEKLFEAFRACARTSPCHISNTKGKGKPRAKTKQKKPQPGGGSASDAVGGTETDAVVAGSPDLASGVAAAEPRWVPVPVRNTFVHFDEVASLCSSIRRGAKTDPVLRATVAEQEEEEEEEDHDGVWNLEEEALKTQPHKMEDIRCTECGAEDPCGWRKHKENKYWCSSCWVKYARTKREDTGKYVPELEPSILVAGGPAEKFLDLDPIILSHKTEVQVKNQCCLKVAQECGKGACMLVNGREHGPLAEHKFGQGADVIKGSTLQQAVQATETSDAAWVCPRPGGIYVPDVLVRQDSTGTPFETPFRVSMVYAAAPRGEEGVQGEDMSPASRDKLVREMREKILNVLRKCHQRGHKELVLGAWGCGWRNLPCRDVAEVFRDVLLGGGDAAGAFHRVTFAIRNTKDWAIFTDVFQSSARAATALGLDGSDPVGGAALGPVFQ